MRIRTIKPEFWQNETIATLPEFTRLLAIALLNYADDHGYFMANHKLIAGNLFPFEEDSKKIPRSIQELSCVDYLELGIDSKGRQVARVVNFDKHQRVDKPKPSIIKEDFIIQEASKNRPRRIQDASKEEGKGIGKEMEQGREGEQGAALAPIVSNQSDWHRDSPMHDLMKRINSLHSTWAKPAQWNRMEMESLKQGTGGQLDELTDDEWEMLRDYLSKPDEKGFWRPKNRSKFVESFPDVWQACQRWKDAQPKTATTNSKDSVYF
jgi:hypothetical protein